MTTTRMNPKERQEVFEANRGGCPAKMDGKGFSAVCAMSANPCLARDVWDCPAITEWPAKNAVAFWKELL